MADDLRALHQLATLVSEANLSQLAARKAACAALRQRLAELDAPRCEARDIALPTQAHVALRYRTWVEGRRKQLNIQLSSALAEALRAEGVARQSFGRHLVLDEVLAAQRAQEATLARRRHAQSPSLSAAGPRDNAPARPSGAGSE